MRHARCPVVASQPQIYGIIIFRYFAKVLAQSEAGKDPFKAPPPPARPRDIESILDPDLETVGAVLEVC